MQCCARRIEPEEIDVAADGTTSTAPATTTPKIKYGPVITLKPKG